VVEIIGVAPRIDVRNAVTLLDRHPVPEEAPNDPRDPRGHRVGGVHWNALSEILDAVDRDHRADALAALDSATDAMLGEEDAVPHRLHCTLAAVTHDLRGGLVTKPLSGVVEDGADLRPAHRFDHGIAVLARHITRAECDHHGSDLPFQTPVLAQHRCLDEDLRLPGVEHLIEIEGRDRDSAGFVGNLGLLDVADIAADDTLHLGRAVQNRFGETDLSSDGLRIPSFEHEDVLETLCVEVVSGTRRQLASAPDQHAVIARFHPSPEFSSDRKPA
jgi:hypothetical protein